MTEDWYLEYTKKDTLKKTDRPVKNGKTFE